MDGATICRQCGQTHESSRQHIFQYVRDVDEDLLCQICRQPFVEPFDTPCGHTFCGLCIRGFQKLRKFCPLDRKQLPKHELRLSTQVVRRLVDKLLVHCPLREYCQERVVRCELESHLTQSCRGFPCRCPRQDSGCDFIGPRCLLEEHLWDCLSRTENKKNVIAQGEEMLVEMPKGQAELGISIVGGSDTPLEGIFVQDINSTGVVARDGRLRTADQLLEANGLSLRACTHAQARNILTCNTPTISLLVVRGKVSSESFYADQSTADQRVVHLIKAEDSNWPIGFKQNSSQPGVYIQNVLPGLATSGHIGVGDRVLEIGQHDVRCATPQQAQQLLQMYTSAVALTVNAAVRGHQKQPSAFSITSDEEDSFGSNMSLVPQGKEKVVIVHKENSETTLGMSVAGGSGTPHGDLPVFITKLTPGSPAARTGQLQRGDILLSIRGTSLSGLTHREAVALLKSASSSDSVRLRLIQGDGQAAAPGLSPNWRNWLAALNHGQVQKQVILSRNIDNNQLGIVITGGFGSCHGSIPIFVTAICSQGSAAENGQLHRGDQILSVNGAMLEGLTLEQASQLLEQTSSPLLLDVLSRPGSDV